MEELYRQAFGADATTGIAAPLLAGAAVATVGVVVQQPDALRWPGVSLLLVVIAASILVASVQFGVLARRYGPSADDVNAWRQAQDDPLVSRTFADAVALCAWWADYARWTYGLGVIALWAEIAVAIMPSSGQDQAMWRWAAVGVAGGLAMLEIGWLVVARTRRVWFRPLAAARRRYLG